MGKPTQAEQLTALTEQIAALSAKVTQLDQDVHTVPHLPRMLLDWKEPPSPPRHHGSLAAVLRYHERSSRTQSAAYYGFFGALYCYAVMGLLFGAPNAPMLPGILRVLAIVLYLIVSLGNTSCILLPTARLQFLMVAPTIIAATLAAILSAAIEQSMGRVGVAVFSALFWCLVIVVHIRFASGIRGRIDQRQWTLELIKRAEAEERAHGSEPGVPP